MVAPSRNLAKIIMPFHRLAIMRGVLCPVRGRVSPAATAKLSLMTDSSALPSGGRSRPMQTRAHAALSTPLLGHYSAARRIAPRIRVSNRISSFRWLITTQHSWDLPHSRWREPQSRRAKITPLVTCILLARVNRPRGRKLG